MTTVEMIRNVHVTQNYVTAGALSDHLRSRGLDYDAQVRLYAKHNGLSRRDARDAWEDLMAQADACNT